MKIHSIGPGISFSDYDKDNPEISISKTIIIKIRDPGMKQENNIILTAGFFSIFGKLLSGLNAECPFTHTPCQGQ
jgi:hypothetical protein